MSSGSSTSLEIVVKEWRQAKQVVESRWESLGVAGSRGGSGRGRGESQRGRRRSLGSSWECGSELFKLAHEPKLAQVTLVTEMALHCDTEGDDKPHGPSVHAAAALNGIVWDEAHEQPREVASTVDDLKMGQRGLGTRIRAILLLTVRL